MKKEDSFKNSKVIILPIIIILVILIMPQVIAMPPPSVTSEQLDKYDGSSNVIWQKSDMGFTLEEQHYLAIGSGRGDGVMRIYSTTDEIHEYTFLTDHWKKIDFGDAFLLNSGIAIGNVRNDGKDRVYVTKYSVHEYYYDSNSWVGGKVRDTSIIDEGLVIGDLHNDGVYRIYITDRDGVAELSYNYGDWDLSRINNQPYAKLTIADGRNDGILRLYAAINNHVYEYSWSGRGWQVEDLAVFNIYNDMYSIAAGNGRNDGKNRIYVSGDSKDPNNGAIYELSYDNQRWQYIAVSDSVSVNHMIVANGRNDGKNHLYTGNSKGIGEYTYNGKWVKTSNVETNFNVNDLAIGNGRNDGINRIYVTGNDNHIYEYTLNVEKVTPTENTEIIPTVIDITTSPTTTPISTTEKPYLENKKTLMEYIKENIWIVQILTFLFGGGVLIGRLDKYNSKKREKDALKNRLNDFISFWGNSDKLTITNKQKELNKMGNKINDLKIEKLPQDIVDKTHHIRDEVLELSETTIYNDEGENKKEFEERGNKLLDEAKDLLKKL